MNYRYITQDIIDAGSVNITSPAMYEEAREYNIDAHRNYVRRSRIHIGMGIWFIAQNVLIFLMLFILIGNISIKQADTGTSTSSAMIWLAVAGLIAYVVFYGYFVVIRKKRTPLMMVACSAPMMIAHPALGILVLANGVIGYLYNKAEKELETKPGYPDFTQLAITTIDSEVNTVEELTFENIRERAVNAHRHDGSFLK